MSVTCKEVYVSLCFIMTEKTPIRKKIIRKD